MGRFAKAVRMGAAILALVAVSACTAIYRNHGYAPVDADLEKVVVGQSTRADVQRAVGRPSSIGVLADSGWYYVGSRFRHYAWRAPEEIERQVVAISFDKNGKVENVERFGLEDGEVVVLSRRVTDSNIKGLSFLRQLLGNIGNISAGDFLSDN